MRAPLELTDTAREQLHELEELADKVEEDPDDRNARTALRRALKESAPEVVSRCADTAWAYRRILAKTASGGNPLVREGIAERASRMATELAGENPTPLEVLLSERIASLWVLVELQEALNAAWYDRENERRPAPAYMLQMVRLQEAAHRRFLAAIRELARVRKLQKGVDIQYNTQINVR